jgi:hypothetical protein
MSIVAIQWDQQAGPEAAEEKQPEKYAGMLNAN